MKPILTHTCGHDGKCAICSEDLTQGTLLPHGRTRFDDGERVGKVITESGGPVCYLVGANDSNPPCGIPFRLTVRTQPQQIPSTPFRRLLAWLKKGVA